jgi:hypothetical protein
LKKLIIFLLISVNIFSAVASPADPTLHKAIQPNGDTISISLYGAEYGSHKDDATIERIINLVESGQL